MSLALCVAAASKSSLPETVACKPAFDAFVDRTLPLEELFGPSLLQRSATQRHGQPMIKENTYAVGDVSVMADEPLERIFAAEDSVRNMDPAFDALLARDLPLEELFGLSFLQRSAMQRQDQPVIKENANAGEDDIAMIGDESSGVMGDDSLVRLVAAERSARHMDKVGKAADPGVGRYRVAYPDGLPVTRETDFNSDTVGKLRKGDVVHVLKVWAGSRRVRGYIHEPLKGWISLRMKDYSICFASMKNSKCSPPGTSDPGHAAPSE